VKERETERETVLECARAKERAREREKLGKREREKEKERERERKSQKETERHREWPHVVHTPLEILSGIPGQGALDAAAPEGGGRQARMVAARREHCR